MHTPQEVASLLTRVASRLMRDLHRHLRQECTDAPVTMAQMRVLTMALYDSPTLSQVADALRVTRPTATRLVDGLVQRGWLLREPDPGDRRQVRLHTTPAGAAVQAKVQEIMHTAMVAHLSRLTPEALDALHEGLRALDRVLEAQLNAEEEK